jgi:hypothetical protein
MQYLTLFLACVAVYLYNLFGTPDGTEEQYKSVCLGVYAAIQFVYLVQPWKFQEIFFFEIIGTVLIVLNGDKTFYQYYATALIAAFFLGLFTIEIAAARTWGWKQQNTQKYFLLNPLGP